METKKMYIGISSTDQDSVKKNVLSGAICVIDEEDNIVFLSTSKERRKEEFYAKCLQKAVDLGVENNVMVNNNYPLIIQYFKDNEGEKYLAKTPKLKDDVLTKFGVRITSKIDDEETKLLKKLIDKNEFIKELVYKYIVEKNNIMVEAYCLALINKYFN